MKEYFLYIKKTIAIFWDEKRNYLIGFVFLSIIVDLSSYINVIAISVLVNKIEESLAAGQSFSNMHFLIIGIGIIFALPYFLQPIMDYFDRIFRYYVEQKLQIIRTAKWADLDLPVRDNPKHQDLMYRVVKGFGFHIYNFLFRNLRLLSVIVQVAVASGAIIHFNFLLFLGLIVFMAPELIVLTKYSHNVWGIWHWETPTRRFLDIIYNIFYDQKNIEEIKVNRTKAKLLDRMSSYFEEFFNNRKQLEKKVLGYSLLARTLSHGMMIFSFYLIFRALFLKEIPVGTTLFYIMSLITFRNALATLISSLSSQLGEMKGVRDYFTFMELGNVILPPVAPKQAPTQAPEIRFENVSFQYPFRQEYTFKNLNLTLKSGEKIAIVGLNGAGKSTLIKLLLRFYDVTEGKILINNVDIRDLDLASYYDLIAVLFQDYLRYKFTVKEAISASTALENLELAKIIAAASKSGADDFIEKYAENYETQLGKEFQGGIEPSVGQWQKIAMASAFYKQPKLYILDEPTAAIDAESEEKIFESLAQLPDDISVILISHRFSTVRRADKIIVLEDGRILEQGTHQELMDKKGRYYDLFTKQAKGYQ